MAIQVYEPRNYHDSFKGEVTARYALAMSLNNATVRLAQEVGFDKVASLARAAGISSVRATPSIALGSYDATPLEMAGAYTVFGNAGKHLSPQMLRSVRDSKGEVLERYDADSKQVLDPRVAYVLTTMMQSVIDSGTGYPVRARGFTAPAAGKTGTSHDAWFAGYTTNLLCIVWVGNDDYTDLKLAGGATAAPIWAEFMKRAVKVPAVLRSQAVLRPAGGRRRADRQSHQHAGDAVLSADLHGRLHRRNRAQADPAIRLSPTIAGVFSKILGIGSPPAAPPPADTNGTVQTTAAGVPASRRAAGRAVACQPAQKETWVLQPDFRGQRAITRTQPPQNTAPASDKGNKNPPQ